MVFTEDKELLLTVLVGTLEVHTISCSLDCLQIGETEDLWEINTKKGNNIMQHLVT